MKDTDTPRPVHVIGGGLAGSEAAWQLARAGVPAILHEMRPERGTDAHHTDGLAELVCRDIRPAYPRFTQNRSILGTGWSPVPSKPTRRFAC